MQALVACSGIPEYLYGMKMKNKWMITLFLTLGLCLIWLFTPLHLFILHHLFLNSVHSQLGASLEYTETMIKDKKLIYINPKIDSLAKIHADTLAVDYQFDILKLNLNLNIELDQPKIVLDDESEYNWRNWIPTQKQWELIQIEPAITIRNGLLVLKEKDSIDSLELLFNFNFNGNIGFNFNGFFANPSLNSPNLTLSTITHRDKLEVQLRCNQLDLPLFAHFAGFFDPSFQGFVVTSGTINGHLLATFPDQQAPYLEGNLKIHDLLLKHPTHSLELSAEQASLQLDPFTQSYGNLKHPIPLKGTFSLIQPASLAFSPKSNQESSWKADGIKGQINLNGIEKAEIDFSGNGECGGYTSPFRLMGHSELDSNHNLIMDLIVDCSTNEKLGAEAHITLSMNSYDKLLEMDYKRISPAEGKFFVSLLSLKWPELKNFVWEKGEFSGKMTAQANLKGIETIHFEDINFRRLQSSFNSIHTRCSAENIYGNGHVKLNENDDFLNSLSGELHIDNGLLDISNMQSPFECIQTHLKIENGQIPRSLVSFHLGGLKGILDIEWMKGRELIDININGYASDLQEFIPNQLQEGLSSFTENRIGVLANLKKGADAFELTGTMHVDKNDSDQPDLIHFGCRINQELFNTPLAFISDGWFYARNLPLEKFISPFIFRNNLLNMQGLGEFIGSFDHTSMSVKYKTNDLTIENEDLLIKAKDFFIPPSEHFVGSHTFDLIHLTHEGVFPFHHASYFDKNSGLLFNDIQGTVHFNNQTLTIDPIEAYCLNNYFCGKIDLDYQDPSPGVFSVHIASPMVSGTIPNVQKLLKHISEPTFLQNIPMEGTFAAIDSGLDLRFEFLPGDYNLKAYFKGEINNGYIPGNSYNLSLKDLYMDVEFNHDTHMLAFSDIQGAVLVGKANLVKEYPIRSGKIIFDRIDKQDFLLDLAVFDQNDELLRISGHTEDLGNNEKEWICHLSETHISKIFPKNFVLKFKNWEEISQFQLSSDFPLAALVNDLGRFKQTGLVFLNPGILEQLTRLKDIKGNLILDFSSEPTEKEYTFSIVGRDLKIGSHYLNDPKILVRHRGSRWGLEAMNWNQSTLFAELDHFPDKLRVNSFGLTIDSMLVGLTGDLDFDDQTFEAKINLFEADLDDLRKYEFLSPFFSKGNPSGQIQGEGKLRISKPDLQSGFNVKCNLSTKLRNLMFDSMSVKIDDPINVHFELGKEIAFENLQAVCSTPQSAFSLGMKKAAFDVSQERIQCHELTFCVPAQGLDAFSKKVETFFPDLFSKSFQPTLTQIKKDGFLQGSLTFSKDPDKCEANLSLSDGVYFYKNQLYDLKKPMFYLLNDHLQFSASSTRQNCSFSVIGHTQCPEADKGSLIFLVKGDEQTADPLVVNWEEREGVGTILTSVQGDFQGIKCQLNQAPKEGTENTNFLNGVVHIDLAKSLTLLPNDLKQTITELELGTEMMLNGFFWLNSDYGALLDNLSFKGEISTPGINIKGFQLEKMQASLHFQPNQVEVSDCVIDDISGSIYCQKAIFFKTSPIAEWKFLIPNLLIKSFRPELLRSHGGKFLTSNRMKSLICKKISVENLQGSLNALSTWTGSGSLQFLNSTRKAFANPLLAIPSEIVLRIGLDPHVLNPVTGSIFFNWVGRRFYLTRFKDVYSEGRGSKFYLAKTPNPSWIDINGQLSIFIGMRQYNLIFKIAELFTFSIDGSISEPRYHLQKQSKNHKK